MLKDAGRRAGISLPENIDVLMREPPRCDQRTLMQRIAALPCAPQRRFQYLVAFNVSGRFRRRPRFKVRRLQKALAGDSQICLAILYVEMQRRILQCEKKALARRR